ALLRHAARRSALSFCAKSQNPPSHRGPDAPHPHDGLALFLRRDEVDVAFNRPVKVAVRVEEDLSESPCPGIRGGSIEAQQPGRPRVCVDSDLVVLGEVSVERIAPAIRTESMCRVELVKLVIPLECSRLDSP